MGGTTHATHALAEDSATATVHHAGAVVEDAPLVRHGTGHQGQVVGGHTGGSAGHQIGGATGGVRERIAIGSHAAAAGSLGHDVAL